MSLARIQSPSRCAFPWFRTVLLLRSLKYGTYGMYSVHAYILLVHAVHRFLTAVGPHCHLIVASIHCVRYSTRLMGPDCTDWAFIPKVSARLPSPTPPETVHGHIRFSAASPLSLVAIPEQRVGSGFGVHVSRLLWRQRG